MSEIEAVPNQYIVVFKDDTPEDVCRQHYEWAQSVQTVACAARDEGDDGPELTGVGEQFKIDTLTGYIGSFDESTKNDIQSRDEASPTYPSPLEGNLADWWDIGRLHRAGLHCFYVYQRDAEARPVMGAWSHLERQKAQRPASS